jgi:hypothetical protein
VRRPLQALWWCLRRGIHAAPVGVVGLVCFPDVPARLRIGWRVHHDGRAHTVPITGALQPSGKGSETLDPSGREPLAALAERAEVGLRGLRQDRRASWRMKERGRSLPGESKPAML